MPTHVPASDGTVKLVFPAGGGQVFEAAFFHVPGRERPYIACVSTQVGCAVRCGFCATRDSGFIRQLSSDEIGAQISAVAELAFQRGARENEIEVSFMGMGEPLANRGSLLGAIALTHASFPLISRVSVSTVGPSERINALALGATTSPIPIHLQISLHATSDAIRRTLIPGVHDSIERLLAAGAAYSRRTGDRVCLNYVLLKELNDTDDDATWFDGVDHEAFYVKLTHLNAVADLPPNLQSSTPERFDHFSRAFSASGLPCKVFRGDGLDIKASCGQLAARPVELYRSVDFAKTA